MTGTRRRSGLTALCLACVAIAATAAAPASAWYFELANDDGDANVEVYFVPQGSATLQAYTLFVDFDETKLNWSLLNPQTPPTPLTGDFFGKPFSPAGGQVANVNGATISGGATLTQRTLLGKVGFYVEPAGALNGTPDVTFGTARKGFLVAVNGALFEGASVPVVLGSGLELPRPACADGADNDGDSLTDHPNDPGCGSANGTLENPQCDDGLDNDGDGARDWDGAGLGSPDPQCNTGARNKETPGCGIGFELAIVVPLLAAARRRKLGGSTLACIVLAGALLFPFVARAEEPGDTPAFRAAAQALPLLSLEVRPDSELWIRVEPERAAEARDVMADVAALYRTHRAGSEPVRVLLFVGQRPIASETYGE
jgi:hypothetical protein